MTISRVNVGGWAAYETLTSAQMNQLDINMTYALDGNAGGDYSPSSDLKVYGKILGESVATRDFLLPMTVGQPEDGNWAFNYNGSRYRWLSDASANDVIYFGLNRFINTGCILRRVRAWVDPGATQTGTNRMMLEIMKMTGDGSGGLSGGSYLIDRSYFPSEADHTAYYLTCASGIHDGGDGQASLTNSIASWVTNYLVGCTIYNITDGSSGTITANTGTNITATLSGGTDDDWDDDDEYTIELSEVIDLDYQYVAKLTGTANASADAVSMIEVQYTEGDYLAP